MTEYTFSERTPEEAGFSAIFDAKIVPFLKDMEGERAEKHAKSRLHFKMLIGAAVALAALAIYLELYVGIFAAFGLAILGTNALKHFSGRGINERLAGFIGPILCDFIGDAEHTRKAGKSFVDIDRTLKLGILPSYTSSKFEDGIKGTWRGVEYRVLGAKLQKGDNGNGGSSTVFQGVVFNIATPVPMPRIVFLRERGALTGLTETMSSARRNLDRLPIPDAEVEKVYAVYTDDIAAAQEKMTPEFGHTLLAISNEEQGGDRYLGAAFDGNRLFLALELNRDFLSLGSFESSLGDFEENLHQALADLMIPRQIIDRLVDG